MTTTEPDTDPDSRQAPSEQSAGEPAARPGRTELGSITVQERAVAKIAARAVTEVPNAGSAAQRVLGVAVGDAVPGLRGSNLGASPKVSVDVDLSVASVELAISVRWPASIPEVTAAVRARVIARLGELTALRVTDVRIHVSDLVTQTAAPPRVQ